MEAKHQMTVIDNGNVINFLSDLIFCIINGFNFMLVTQ